MKRVFRIICIVMIILTIVYYSVVGLKKEELEVVKIPNTNNISSISTDIEEIEFKHKYPFDSEIYTLFDDSAVEDVEFSNSVEIISVGDIMAHTIQFEAAYEWETKSYNFDEQFKYISDKLSSKNFAIGNLETVFAGKDKRYSGKNMIFNAPDSLAKSLKEAGIDIVTTANNHSLDRGYYGLSRTIDVLDNLGILHSGTYKTEEDSEEVLIFEENGISFALLSYSYSTNGWPMPEENPYALNMLDEGQIINDIKRAKSLGVDIVVVAAHWGLEYQRNPNIHQTNLADSMFYAGADIVLGSHPHVVQPFVNKKMIDSSGEEREKFIIYSMGNFISGQRTSPRDIGMYINFKVTRKGSNPVFIEEVSVMPTWVQSSYVNGKRYMRVLDVLDAITKYENDQINNITNSEYLKLNRIEKETLEHLFKNEELKDYELNENNEYVIYNHK